VCACVCVSPMYPGQRERCQWFDFLEWIRKHDKSNNEATMYGILKCFESDSIASYIVAMNGGMRCVSLF